MSMAKEKMRGMKGTYAVSLPKEAVISPKHQHFYHGSKCPVLVDPNGKCNNDCLDQCWAHGPNCKVGICLSCWIYEYKKTVEHFMPSAMFRRKGRKIKRGKKGGDKN